MNDFTIFNALLGLIAALGIGRIWWERWHDDRQLRNRRIRHYQGWI